MSAAALAGASCSDPEAQYRTVEQGIRQKNAATDQKGTSGSGAEETLGKASQSSWAPRAPRAASSAPLVRLHGPLKGLPGVSVGHGDGPGTAGVGYVPLGKWSPRCIRLVATVTKKTKSLALHKHSASRLRGQSTS